ncbi:tripartite tricarboxylate transporter TctB family protein [Variovorax sp. RKNM96]|uniref:tripartite tricarboxylate transporter TctB family protein n=1 Tax=Variovorax sp. RKNM96 TaxID=2681552 RepID=UPI001980E9A1|nr:tripartite tricarboxylate transporter TctB family protein [Variovorax sp. RKNM96]QSI33248.1 tripartite tricarboxylate transporter TctB family protein [Variovorax sp. RKNM96]
MEHEEISDGAARSGVATYVVEAVVAALLLVIGLVVVFEARKLGAGWTSDGPGSGYFPFFIGVIITISGAGILYQALLGKNRNTEVFVDSVQLKRVLSVLLPATVYVLAITFVGLYVASAVYIALFMIVLGKYSWVKSVIAALAVNTVFFCMFEVWFKVPLFKGALDPLRFLGY